MSAVGQQILDRLSAMETAVSDLQLGQPVTGVDDAGQGLKQSMNQLKEEMAQLKLQMGNGSIGMGMGTVPTESFQRRLWNPKDCMPEVLNNDYRNRWRAWSYKARDWLAQLDPALKQKLERVEAMSSTLSDEYIEALKISDHVDSEIRRFLVHRLDGDPAEVVRNSADKPGIEQYRCLAQLCDPAAGGRDWQDARHLYYPTPATTLQNVHAKIAEWKNFGATVQSQERRWGASHSSQLGPNQHVSAKGPRTPNGTDCCGLGENQI